MFGDNHQNVMTNSTTVHTVLKKHHTAFSYHHVHTTTVANFMHLLHMDSNESCADVLTKIQSHTKVWPLIELFLLWKGETRK